MSTLPKAFTKFQQKHGVVFAAYEALGKAAAESGPLTEREAELVRLGIAFGAKMEGAVHSHCRRALEAGVSPEEIRHAIILGVTTMGFPSMMAALSWAEEILNQGDHPG